MPKPYVPLPKRQPGGSGANKKPKQQGPICPPQQPTDFTVSPDAPDRFTVDEDCLFLSVTAPSGARARPVLFWIQGGGFTSNSNANYNASAIAADGDVVVVQIVRPPPPLSEPSSSDRRC